LLHAQGVTKAYKSLTAVDRVDLDIEAGEIFALLGPNGAGKTTFIGCVAGLVAGFDGSISIAGYDVVRDYQITRRLIGLVPQELNQDVFFNVRDVVAIQGGYFGVRPDDPRIDELLESFSLGDKRDANTRWLSGGMKRRLMICKALVHDPVLLFLDEPTAGVDVELREELWEYVLNLRARGTTIVLTTHYLEEAERLADRIGILHKGRLRRVDSRADLLESYGRSVIEITLSASLAAPIRKKLLAIPGVIDVADLSVTIDATVGDANAIIEAIIASSATIDAVRTHRSSLEEIFREIIAQEDAKDEAEADALAREEGA
jgi:ABC-2 type transport system ATP-binding protein